MIHSSKQCSVCPLTIARLLLSSLIFFLSLVRYIKCLARPRSSLELFGSLALSRGPKGALETHRELYYQARPSIYHQ